MGTTVAMTMVLVLLEEPSSPEEEGEEEGLGCAVDWSSKIVEVLLSPLTVTTMVGFTVATVLETRTVLGPAATPGSVGVGAQLLDVSMPPGTGVGVAPQLALPSGLPTTDMLTENGYATIKKRRKVVNGMRV